MSYSGKTNWQYNDLVTEHDLNRIEQGIQDADEAAAAAQTAADDAQEAADTAQSGLAAHTAAGTAHGSTSAATPGAIVQRDADGRFKAAAPSASDDVARKAEVDNLLTGSRTFDKIAVNGAGGVTAYLWSTVSGNSAGTAMWGQNCYLDPTTANYKYKNTHGSLGARGIVYRTGANGTTPWWFDTGAVATTADATFTPTLVPLATSETALLKSAAALNPGVPLMLVSPSGATPNKHLRADNGNFEILSSDFSRILLQLTDGGSMSIAGNPIIPAVNGTPGSGDGIKAMAGATKIWSITRNNNDTLIETYGALLHNGKAIVSATTADVTYYVRTDGSDSNNGLSNTAGGAFKTIGKAVSMLPQIINHEVTINVAAGTYAETVSLFGFSGKGVLYLNGDTSVSTSRQIQGINLQNVALFTGITGFSCTLTTSSSIVVTTCLHILLDRMNLVSSAASNVGLWAQADAFVELYNSTISSKNIAVLSTRMSRVLVSNTTGSNNNAALQAERGGTIYEDAVSIGATTLRIAATGGVITATIRNPWGDNTYASRDSAAFYFSTVSVAASSTYYKIPILGAEWDRQGGINTSTHEFTAKNTGVYDVGATITGNTVPSGTRLVLWIYKNGGSLKLIGENNTSAGGDMAVSGTAKVFLMTGDKLSFYVISSTSGYSTYGTDSRTSYAYIQQSS